MRIRFGILGCGNIARTAIAPALRWSNNASLVAIGSRSLATAERLASELGAERAYGSYHALLEDRDVDAIYIGLPNGLHAEWCLRAAEAGKHVLCEKSLCLEPEVAARVAAVFASKRLRLVEAFMYRHHPQWDVVHNALPKLGELRLIRASLCGMNAKEDDHRWSPTLGGGALFDVTCYGVNVARWLVGREPVRATATGDVYTNAATLTFENGAIATVAGSLRSASEQSLSIVGADGTLVVARPFVPGWDSTEITLNAEVIRVPGANHFLHQVEHFAELVADPARALGPAETGADTVAACALIQRALAGPTTQGGA